jgi:hypothetical protein
MNDVLEQAEALLKQLRALADEDQSWYQRNPKPELKDTATKSAAAANVQEALVSELRLESALPPAPPAQRHRPFDTTKS